MISLDGNLFAWRSRVGRFRDHVQNLVPSSYRDAYLHRCCISRPKPNPRVEPLNAARASMARDDYFYDNIHNGRHRTTSKETENYVSSYD